MPGSAWQVPRVLFRARWAGREAGYRDQAEGVRVWLEILV